MDNPRETGEQARLDASAIALNRSVDALTADDLAATSLLPGWTRAHVVAHLALNGRALARVLDAVGRGEPAAMYESDDQRDAEINEFAQAQAAELRDGLLAATTEFEDAVAAIDDDRWGGSFHRTPGGPSWPTASIVATRRREVEIHHADLGASYTRHDWPPDFVVDLLDVVSVDQIGSGPFQLWATDLDLRWRVGAEGAEGGPTVSGSGADLGWWLTGRSTGTDLRCESGTLPVLGPWRRATSPSSPHRP